MKQVTKFYITSFLKNQTYFTPVFVLLLQFHHLSFSEIFWVFSIGSIVSFILEIPTGVIADLYGKRKSIIISKFIIFVSYIIFGFSDNFFMFVIAQAVFEIGNSFRTGTETAYIYDYLKQNKGNYTEVKGKQKFYARVGESLSSAVGGFIAASFGFNSVFFFACLPAFLNFILSLRWEKIKENEKKVTMKDSLELSKVSLKKLFKNKKILLMTINIMIFTSVLAAIQKFIQPYMKDAMIPVEVFGIVYAVSLILAAVSVRYSYIVEKKLGTIRTINYLTFFAVIPTLIIGFKFISILGVALFFIIIIIENIRSPIANSEFNEYVESKERSTLGSILSQSKSLGKIIILPIAGFFAENYSMYTSMIILSGIILMNAVFFYVRKS